MEEDYIGYEKLRSDRREIRKKFVERIQEILAEPEFELMWKHESVRIVGLKGEEFEITFLEDRLLTGYRDYAENVMKTNLKGR
jgi:hypothetical protein